MGHRYSDRQKMLPGATELRGRTPAFSYVDGVLAGPAHGLWLLETSPQEGKLRSCVPRRHF